MERPANEQLKPPALVDTADRTNDFFDNEPLMDLPMGELFVDGEVENPGKVDLSSLPVRSVIVKETFFDGDSSRFHGAYRFDGYSLYDILDRFIPDKANKEEFPPIIDLFVTVTSKTGERAVFSWGEIYYPVNRHQIIIANKVMLVVPSKTKDRWPVPTIAKVVAGPDLVTERNISDPVRITVGSIPKSFEVDREKKYAPSVEIILDEQHRQAITSLPPDLNRITYPTIFYGRGRGIHSITPFTGVMFKELVGNQIPITRTTLREGFFIAKGCDGYRAALTFSEVMNRNDQSEVLLVDVGQDTEGGRFRFFTSADYFSDRAVFALEVVYYWELE
jgi:hypothetical protein